MASSQESARPPEINGHHSPATGPQTELAPTAVLGGLGTGPEVSWLYKNLFDEGCFLPPPGRGFRLLEDMQEELTEKVSRTKEQHDERKLLLVGHSLGALLATKIAVAEPDLVAGVVTLGGAHQGYDKDTLATHTLKLFAGRHPQAGHLRHNSDFMQEHAEDMATKWPDDTPLHVVATPLDILIVPPHGFDVRAGNNKVSKRLVIPSFFGAGNIFRKLCKTEEDVEMLPTRAWVDHFNMPRSEQIQDYVHQVRHEIAGVAPEETPATAEPNVLHLPHLPRLRTAA